MTLKPRHRRFAWVAAGLVAIGIAAALVLNALGSNMSWFITPTEVAEGKAPADRNFRIGGNCVSRRK